MKGWGRLGWPGVLTIAMAACGGIAVIDGEGASGSGGASATNGSGMSNGSGMTNGNGGASSNNSGVGAGTNCPGCPGPEYCDYPDNLCGQVQTAVCSPSPGSCEGVPVSPTCGCDGVVYDSPCQAALLGIDISVLEICSTPQDTFPCGQTFCALGGEYCRVVVSDVAELPSQYSCLPLPGQCLMVPSPGCSCLSGVPCGDLCDEPLPLRFRVTCPGG